MEGFTALIKQRRSVRRFTEELLTPGEVELILKAALMAPSSKRSTPWEFVVVEDKEMLKQLAGCKEQGASFLEGCALAVVVSANVEESDVWIEDAAIASIYMQLQAEDLGIGSCWCQVRNRMAQDTGSNEYISRLLDIPYPLEVLSIIGFGHKAAEHKPFNEEKLQWEKVHIGRYAPKI
jgi:nitroreductase